jgi:GMP synthase-like glutamine amidotransferase
MKILLIDNTMDTDCWGSNDVSRFLLTRPDITVHTRRAPHGDLPRDLAQYDRLVLSGSRTSCLEKGHWIDQLDQAVKTFLNLGRPFLGICYGHQTLCRVVGDRTHLRIGTTPEFGWTEILQTEKNSLFTGLPEKFHSFSSHYEEVSSLPKGMRSFAKSERCTIQAVQLEGKAVFGIQFHPEKLEDEGNQSLEKRMNERKKDGLLGYGKSKSLYNSAVGSTLFQNFLEHS